MYRSILITVLPQTSATTPLRTEIKLTKGILYRVTIQSAQGCNWEVYTRVLYREHNLIPVHNELWLPLSGEAIPILLNWNEWDGTYIIYIDCCAPDSRFTHDVLFSFELEEKPSFIEVFREFIARGF